MKPPITFIHCADLHLDSPFQGLKTESEHIFDAMKESTFRALDKLVEQAIFHQVDFVLMAGDIFDHHKPSLKALMRFKKAMEQLKKKHIQVFISYGNHDFTQGKEELVTLPGNVHCFTEEEVTKKVFWQNGEPIAYIYGFSYTKRAVTENKVSEYIKKDDNGYHIAMLHGSVATDTDHDVYAPFHVSELVEKPFDYWALGHIHKRELLQETPPIMYPGNMQGRSRKESGEKGCLLIDMTPHRSEITFLPLQHVRFESIALHVHEPGDISELEQSIVEELTKLREETGSVILDMKIMSPSAVLHNWNRNGYLDELIEAVNDQFSELDDWMFVRNLELDIIPEWNVEELKSGGHFIGELIRNTEQGLEKQSLSPLFNHKKARKYLDPLSSEELSELQREARDELLYLLMKE